MPQQKNSAISLEDMAKIEIESGSIPKHIDKNGGQERVITGSFYLDLPNLPEDSFKRGAIFAPFPEYILHGIERNQERVRWCHMHGIDPSEHPEVMELSDNALMILSQFINRYPLTIPDDAMQSIVDSLPPIPFWTRVKNTAHDILNMPRWWFYDIKYYIYDKLGKD